MSGQLPPAPGEVEARAAERFREAAARAGFDERAFGVLGQVGPPGWKGRMRAASLPSAACGTLVRALVIGDAVGRDDLAAAVGGGEVLAALEAARVLRAEGSGLVKSPLLLMAAGGVLALSDAIEDPVSLSPADDYIIPVAATSRIVDDLAVRVPCELAVDMGCGQGYLAQRSLSHARTCIATDINPRAIAFARATASLNGSLSRVDLRVGSLFEPVGDVLGSVDLFTCNPPFIINPAAHTTASETRGDAMLEQLVRHMPRTLGEGGWATVIGVWEHRTKADWEARARAWLEGSACDALVLRFGTFSAEEYFRSSTPPEARAAAEPVWTRWCESRGVGALTYGGFILHKRAGSNWRRTLTTPIDHRTGSASEQLLAYFATQSIIESGRSLLDLRFRAPAAGWRFDPKVQLTTVPAAPPGLALPLVNAAQFEPVLAAFNGQASAREVMTWLHTSGQWPYPPEHPESSGFLRWLAASGCLEVAD